MKAEIVTSGNEDRVVQIRPRDKTTIEFRAGVRNNWGACISDAPAGPRHRPRAQGGGGGIGGVRIAAAVLLLVLTACAGPAASVAGTTPPLTPTATPAPASVSCDAVPVRAQEVQRKGHPEEVVLDTIAMYSDFTSAEARLLYDRCLSHILKGPWVPPTAHTRADTGLCRYCHSGRRRRRRIRGRLRRRFRRSHRAPSTRRRELQGNRGRHIPGVKLVTPHLGTGLCRLRHAHRALSPGVQGSTETPG